MDVCGWPSTVICHLVPRPTVPLRGLVDAWDSSLFFRVPGWSSVSLELMLELVWKSTGGPSARAPTLGVACHVQAH